MRRYDPRWLIVTLANLGLWWLVCLANHYLAQVDLPLIGSVAEQLAPEAAEVIDDDTGLEDAIEQHNQALLDNFVLNEAARIQGISSSQAIREYEEAGLVDDDNGGGTNSSA